MMSGNELKLVVFRHREKLTFERTYYCSRCRFWPAQLFWQAQCPVCGGKTMVAVDLKEANRAMRPDGRLIPPPPHLVN